MQALPKRLQYGELLGIGGGIETHVPSLPINLDNEIFRPLTSKRKCENVLSIGRVSLNKI